MLRTTSSFLSEFMKICEINMQIANKSRLTVHCPFLYDQSIFIDIYVVNSRDGNAPSDPDTRTRAIEEPREGPTRIIKEINTMKVRKFVLMYCISWLRTAVTS
jgi:hypothetical protein